MTIDTTTTVLLGLALWAYVGKRAWLAYIQSWWALDTWLEYVFVALCGPLVWYGIRRSIVNGHIREQVRQEEAEAKAKEAAEYDDEDEGQHARNTRRQWKI